MKKLNKKGFTIVELVIVIAVIGVLAGVLIPTFGGVIAGANASAALQTARGCLSTALNMSSTGALPGKTTEGKYQTAFFVDQTGDGKVDYAFGYTGNELVSEDLKDIANRLECNTLLLSSDFVIDDEEGSYHKTVDQHWYSIDTNITSGNNRVDPDGRKVSTAENAAMKGEHTGHLDLLCANMLESSYYWDNNWQPKNSTATKIGAPGKITQDWSNGIKYVLSETIMVEDDNSTQASEEVKLAEHDIFINQDLSKKVVILTNFK